MIVLARSGNDVPTVIQEMDRVYGSDSFGIVSPAAIIQAQKHTQVGGASFTLEVGFIAMLVSSSPAAIIQAQKHTQVGGASFTLEVGFIAIRLQAWFCKCHWRCYDSLHICK
jgi:hypothetical protein